LAVATEEGVDLTPDSPGELCVRGWQVMLGYYGAEEATAEAIDGDGWFHTGDIGFVDPEGNLHYVDRLKDMIKPGGENVSAAEVERVIAELDQVSQVAVVGVPDPRLGEVPVAFVELRKGALLDEQQLRAHCAAAMASFKVPRRFIFRTDWPLTESGKIQKQVLRSSLAGVEESLIGHSG
jgi:acyl-CoA synthetase (AMP-forming)/AMP-acid ligase II